MIVKPGDKVKCVDNETLETTLTEGQIYTVESAFIDFGYLLLTLTGVKSPEKAKGFYAHRFQHAK